MRRTALGVLFLEARDRLCGTGQHRLEVRWRRAARHRSLFRYSSPGLLLEKGTPTGVPAARTHQ